MLLQRHRGTQGARPALRLLLALSLSVLVSGCAALPMLSDAVGNGDSVKPNPKIKVKWISLAAAPDINENWPVQVELVRVRDETLVDALLRMSADEWFGEGGDGFRLAHPDAVFDYWEVVPGTSIPEVDVKQRGRFGGVLFCGLKESGLPVRVSWKRGGGRMHITVDDSGCTLSAATKKK